MDAIATPFVQGQLRNTPLTVEVRTVCAVSDQSLHLTIDSDPVCHVEDAGADPWLRLPLVNFSKLRDPSIIDAF